jgi:diguanylate cyclase (GGDEF)-like protein
MRFPSVIRRLAWEPMLPEEAPLPELDRRQRAITGLIALCGVGVLLGAQYSEQFTSPVPAQSWAWVITVAVVAMLADSFAMVASFQRAIYVEFSVMVRGAVLVFVVFDWRIILALAVARGLISFRLYVREALPGIDGYVMGIRQAGETLISLTLLTAVIMLIYEAWQWSNVGAYWVAALTILVLSIVFDEAWYRVQNGIQEASSSDQPDEEGALQTEARSLVFNVPLAVLGALAFEASPWMVIAMLGPAVMLSVMLAPVKALAEANRQLSIDSLTGIANRQAFWSMLDGLHKKVPDKPDSVVVGIIDIDDFKRLNDVQGHLAGDQALVAAANTIQQSIRATDLAARYGGEEFAVVLPGATLATGVEVAERVREACERELSAWGCTISMGVVEVVWPHGKFSPKDVVELADSAMYKSKTSGKNRVTAAIAE